MERYDKMTAHQRPESKLNAAIERRCDDLIVLTQELIRIPTLNPPGENYLLICEYLADRLKSSGFEIEMVRALGAPGDSAKYPRWNVIARREGSRIGQCVHFNSHIDVVETGQGWTHDPFGGALVDGRIYGRGACDMKGGLATSIIACEAFLEVFPDYDGAIEISGTADEESGGFGGVAYLAEKGFFSPERVQHVIIPEPLHKDRICLGHRGLWWAELETKGRIAHGSMPFLGDCAVRHMGAVIDELEESVFPALKSRLTEAPVIPEGARNATMNFNSLHGGQTEILKETGGLPSPCVPDSCRLVVDRRVLWEEDMAETKQEFRDAIERVKARRDGFDYELREMFEVAPSMTDKDAPVVQTVSQAIQDTLGVTPEYVVSPGTYDQKHIDRIGHLKNCIAYGPGILDLAHQPDEYIDVEDMVASACVMAAALERLLVEPH